MSLFPIYLLLCEVGAIDFGSFMYGFYITGIGMFVLT